MMHNGRCLISIMTIYFGNFTEVAGSGRGGLSLRHKHQSSLRIFGVLIRFGLGVHTPVLTWSLSSPRTPDPKHELRCDLSRYLSGDWFLLSFTGDLVMAVQARQIFGVSKVVELYHKLRDLGCFGGVACAPVTGGGLLSCYCVRDWKRRHLKVCLDRDIRFAMKAITQTHLNGSAFNLRYQRKTERAQRWTGALHFAKICDPGFSRNALGLRT